MIKKRLLGKKIGMTTVFTENGEALACTVVELLPQLVLDVKTEERDGYKAAVMAACVIDAEKEKTRLKKLNKPQNGVFNKRGVKPHKKIFESAVADDQDPGSTITVDFFEPYKHLDVTGKSKGKGYQGLMKKNNFRGGPGAHGSGFHRHAGSTGQRSTPGKCFKGGPRPSQMGNKNVTVQNIKIEKIDKEKHLMILRGAIPGCNGAYLYFSPAVKRNHNVAAA